MLFCFSAVNASALGMLSRACRFDAIPSTLKAPALILFQYLGMPSSLGDLDHRSASEQQNYWILESITTDYGSLRYYLFAENRVYWAKNTTYGVAYFPEYSYKSPWAAQSLDPKIFPDSRLQIFKFNRRVMFSARAGNPQIVQNHQNSTNEISQAWVMGQHYYYDPVSKSQGYIGSTSAMDCNLGDWGLEDR
jgi:hypothetical protein